MKMYKPMSTQFRFLPSSRGFTLMEMLVVLAIIALITGIVGPRIFGAADKASVQAAQTQVKMLRNSVESFRLEVGRYPTTQEGLNVLVKAPADPQAAARWRGPYLSENEVPLDPWKNPYQYAVPGAGGQPFALYSFGSDGKRGGEGDAADIGILPAN
jgi:general secretion pathway protein G